MYYYMLLYFYMQTITYLSDCFNKGKLSRWADNVMPIKVYIGKFNWYKSKGNASDEYKYTQMIIDGFNLWETLSGGLVSFERTMNLYDSNINIDWKRVDRKSLGSCTFNFDKLGRYYSAELSIGLSDGIIHHQYMDRLYNKTIINVGSVGNAYDTIRNKNKDGNIRETTKSNYLILEGEYGSKEYLAGISFQFIKVPYDIDKELEDENLNIEKENYRFELKEGMYRDMTKVNENFRRLGVSIEEG